MDGQTYKVSYRADKQMFIGKKERFTIDDRKITESFSLNKRPAYQVRHILDAHW